MGLGELQLRKEKDDMRIKPRSAVITCFPKYLLERNADAHSFYRKCASSHFLAW